MKNVLTILRNGILLGALVAMTGAVPAVAEELLAGTIVAEPDNGATGLGAWKYTMTVVWDTGTPYGLSHVDLIIDDGVHCSCTAIHDAIVWGEAPGYLTGEEDDCLIGLEPELNCDGDPSIDLDAPVFKLEPNEGPYCHAGPTGELVVSFYSDFPPGSIADPNLFLVDKYARYSDFGMVTGVFPSLPCDPVDVEPVRWDALKAYYR